MAIMSYQKTIMIYQRRLWSIKFDYDLSKAVITLIKSNEVSDGNIAIKNNKAVISDIIIKIMKLQPIL